MQGKNYLGLFGCCSSPVLAGNHQNVLPCIAVKDKQQSIWNGSSEDQKKKNGIKLLYLRGIERQKHRGINSKNMYKSCV